MRFLLCFLAPLLAWSAPVAAAPTGNASVTVRMAPDGVRATIELDHPVTRFAFQRGDVERQEDFALITPGLKFAEDAVTADAPFSRIDLLVRPTSKERDARYPAHFRVGDGGAFYGPALRPDRRDWHSRLYFALAPGQIRTPAGADPGEGFIYIGPAAHLTHYKGVSVVADPATPPWLVERSRTALAAATAAYTKSLAAPLPRPPLLIVRHFPGGRSFNVGDVTPGAIVTLRFHGDSWKQPDARAAKSIQAFLLHEAFHFWNGGLAEPADGTPTWLHEGGAEYASLLAGFAGGVLSDEDVRARLSESLDRCRMGLQNQGDKPMSKIGFLSNQIRYPCGMVIQWAADLRLRGATTGKRTVMDAWAQMLRQARRRKHHSYALADFYAAAGIAEADRFAPIALLVATGGLERWTALPAALVALGAEIDSAPTESTRRVALLFHVLGRNCRNLAPGTGYGFYGDAETVRLDSPKGCGVLEGDPVLKSIEGGDPWHMSAETYAAVQRRCAAGEPVRFVTADGRTLAAPCDAALGPAPPDFLVRRWRPPASGLARAAAAG